MLPDNVVRFEAQMQKFWDRADPRHTTQVDRFIISFHPDELDPDNPRDWLKALDIGRTFAIMQTSILVLPFYTLIEVYTNFRTVSVSADEGDCNEGSPHSVFASVSVRHIQLRRVAASCSRQSSYQYPS